jgi:hypothetical protein
MECFIALFRFATRRPLLWTRPVKVRLPYRSCVYVQSCPSDTTAYRSLRFVASSTTSDHPRYGGARATPYGSRHKHHQCVYVNIR